MTHVSLRRLLTVSAVLCLLPGSGPAGLALAPRQPGGPGGPGRGQGMRFGGGRAMSTARLSVPALDAIVKLTPAQKGKVTRLHDGYMKQLATLRPQPGRPFDPASVQKMRDMSAATSKQIEALLTAPQKARLAAARKDFGLYRIAGIPLGLYGRLALTAGQKARLQAIQKGLTAGQGNRQGMRQAMQAARQQAAAVLTPAQKAQIEKYRKAHPDEFRGPGGRGGGFAAPRA